MSIFPYNAELLTDILLSDGTLLPRGLAINVAVFGHSRGQPTHLETDNIPMFNMYVYFQNKMHKKTFTYKEQNVLFRFL